MTTFRAGAASDVGQVRSNNQDSKLVVDEVSLFAVADGMGGHQGGEVASAIAVETLEAIVADPTQESIVEAVKEANRRIFAHASENAQLRGMGTTLVGIVLINQGTETEEMAWVNVGDSRVYVLRDGTLHQLSRDHSLVEDLRRGGQLTEEEAAVHPQRNILTRALGIDAEVEVDSAAFEPYQGDRYLLCSDGLFNEVDRDTIVATLSSIEDPDEAATELVRLANQGGGRDNITVVIVDVTDDDGRAVRAAELAAAAAATLAADRAAAEAEGEADGEAVTPERADEAETAEVPALDAGPDTDPDATPLVGLGGPPPPPTEGEAAADDAAAGSETGDARAPDAPTAGTDTDAGSGATDASTEDDEPVIAAGQSAAFGRDEDDLDAEGDPLPFGRETDDVFADLDAVSGGHRKRVVIGVVVGIVVVALVALGVIFVLDSDGYYAAASGPDGQTVSVYQGKADPILFGSDVLATADTPFDDMTKEQQTLVEEERTFGSEEEALAFIDRVDTTAADSAATDEDEADEEPTTTEDEAEADPEADPDAEPTTDPAESTTSNSDASAPPGDGG